MPKKSRLPLNNNLIKPILYNCISNLVVSTIISFLKTHFNRCVFFVKKILYICENKKLMGKITFVTVSDQKGTVKKKKGTVIVKNPIMVTVDKKIGNTKKTKKVRRQVQFVETLDTIFVDEQIEAMGGEKPSPTAVYIIKGKKDVDESETALVKFLEIHSDNIENGGRGFKKFDVETEDELEVQQYQTTSRVSQEVMDADENLAYSIAVWFLGVKYIRLTPNKVKKALYLRCQSDFEFTEKVDEFIKDKTNEHKLLITLALSKDVIKIRNGNKIAWIDSEESDNLFISSNAKDIVSEFATFLKTDAEGRETLKLIASKLDKE